MSPSRRRSGPLVVLETSPAAAQVLAAAVSADRQVVRYRDPALWFDPEDVVLRDRRPGPVAAGLAGYVRQSAARGLLVAPEPAHREAVGRCLDGVVERLLGLAVTVVDEAAPRLPPPDHPDPLSRLRLPSSAAELAAWLPRRREALLAARERGEAAPELDPFGTLVLRLLGDPADALERLATTLEPREADRGRPAFELHLDPPPAPPGPPCTALEPLVSAALARPAQDRDAAEAALAEAWLRAAEGGPDEPDGSLELLARAAVAWPDRGAPELVRGLLSAGHPPRALAVLEAIPALAVDPVAVGVGLALDHLRRDRPARAAALLERLLDGLCSGALSGPGPPPDAALDALRNLVWARHLLGQPGAALAASERLLAHPAGRAARDLANHGGLVWAAGDRARAERILEDAAWLDPDEPLVHTNLARLRGSEPRRVRGGPPGESRPDLTLVSLSRDDETGRRVVPGGCLALLAALRARGRLAELVDGQLLPRECRDDPDALADACGEPGPVIGLSAMADALPLLVRLCAALRERFPDRTVVAGGPGPSPVARPLLELAPGLDVVVHGEGEETLPELLARLDAGGLPQAAGCPGTTVRTADGLVTGPPRPRLTDLDGLPPAAWDAVDLSRYDEVTLVTARGCPHRCTFCSGPGFWGPGRTTRSVESVLAELETLVHDHGVRDVHLEDDSLLQPRRRAVELCRGLRERLPDLTWGCLGRADAVDDVLVTELAASGCRSLFLGLESGSDAVLSRVGKGLSAAVGMAAARRAARELHVRAYFVWGFPFETREDLRQTFSAVGRLSALGVDACYALLSPLPGTPLAAGGGELLLHEGLPFPRLVPEPAAEADRALVAAHPEVFQASWTLPTPGWEDKRRLVARYWETPRIAPANWGRRRSSRAESTSLPKT